MIARPARIVLPAVAALTACALAGCSSSSKKGGGSSTPPATSAQPPATSPAAASSTAAAPSGGASTGASAFESLLIKPSDIPVAGFSLTQTQAAPGGKGIVGVFANADGSRALSDIIVVLPSADAVNTALTGAEGAAGQEIAGSTAKDLAVGTGGKLYSGTTGGGSKLGVLAIFGEGNTFVTLEFDSAKGDTIPEAVVTQVAQAQDAAIKANPPS